MGDDLLVMRRNMDFEITENQRADRARMDAMLARMAGMEAALDRLRKDYDTQNNYTLAVQEQQTEIIHKLTDFSARFVSHVEDEAAERAVLKAIAETITRHAERISVLDRMVWAVIGACGIFACGAVGWALNHVASAVG